MFKVVCSEFGAGANRNPVNVIHLHGCAYFPVQPGASLLGFCFDGDCVHAYKISEPVPGQVVR